MSRKRDIARQCHFTLVKKKRGVNSVAHNASIRNVLTQTVERVPKKPAAPEQRIVLAVRRERAKKCADVTGVIIGVSVRRTSRSHDARKRLEAAPKPGGRAAVVVANRDLSALMQKRIIRKRLARVP